MDVKLTKCMTMLNFPLSVITKLDVRKKCIFHTL